MVEIVRQLRFAPIFGELNIPGCEILGQLRWAKARSAPLRMVPVRSVPIRMVPRRWAPRRWAPLR